MSKQISMSIEQCPTGANDQEGLCREKARIISNLIRSCILARIVAYLRNSVFPILDGSYELDIDKRTTRRT